MRRTFSAVAAVLVGTVAAGLLFVGRGNAVDVDRVAGFYGGLLGSFPYLVAAFLAVTALVVAIELRDGAR
ncbi:hypothetical protein ACFQE1_09925 [Halobium palmae]|uniref:Uncharacterized protein n=1 Tax=Halobium palmae TaxID=1776492 RepID=A0ABD5RZ73_9EURY